MAITLNKEYRFINKEYNKMALNVYGTSSVVNGRNVCLYDKDADPDDEMQRWKYQYDSGYGNRLHCVKNTDYVLDRSSGMTNSCANNAHTYKGTSTKAAESAITFVAVSGETDAYKIRLTNRINNEFLFLTAANNNGTLPASAVTSSTLTTANKNVYWAAEATSGAAHRKQCWEAKEYSSGGSSSGGGEYDNISNQTLSMPIQNMRINVGYKVPIYLTDPATSGNGQHYGADYVDNNLPGGGITVPDNIIASGEGFVYKSGYDENAGYFACIVYPKSYIKTSSTGTYKYQDVTVRYWHMAAINSDFDNVNYTSPKQIHKGDVIGTMGKEGVATGIHLHVECDTDTTPQYTFWSPTHWKSPDELQNGTDSTINPGWVFHKGSNQTVTVRQSDINTEWVLDDDYKYIGNYSIV